MKHLVSINQLDSSEIIRLLDRAALFENCPNRKLLEGRIVATLFFEPSSSSKGESLKDTISMVANYADVIVMRHFLEGAALYASELDRTPIVNAGDGANQHPSQTLLDLYSIRKTQGTLFDRTIALVGDLKYGRTVHSLIEGMAHFRPRFIFVSPPELRMPEECKDFCRLHGIPFTETTDFGPEVIQSVDILYMTRVQRERFIDPEEYERVKNVYVLTRSMLEGCRPTMRILHPLPRVGEIAQDVDDTPQAYYIQQAQNGLYVRQSILCEVLNIEIDN